MKHTRSTAGAGKTPAAKAVKTSPAAPAAAALQPETVGRTLLPPALLSVMLFLSMTVQTVFMTFTCLAVALLSLLWKPNRLRLRERVSVSAVGFLLFAVMFALAGIYTGVETAAAKELYKFFAAFGVAVTGLVWLDRRHLRPMLWGMAIVSAVVAFISLDGAVYGPLWTVWENFTTIFGGEAGDVYQEANGLRINGIYANPNITGSILALGSLIGIWLMRTAESRKSKLAAAVVLAVNAEVFFLCLSRAAILCFGLALLVWLFIAGKAERISLFITMVISAGVVMAASLVMTVLLAHTSLLADVVVLLVGLPIFFLEELLNARVTTVLSGRVKLLAVCGGVFAAAVVGAAVLAMNLTGPYAFGNGGKLTRVLDLAPGTYTLSAEVSGGESAVRIYNRSTRQAMMGETTEYYDGPLSAAAFTVAPTDDGDTYFVFEGTVGTVLESVSLSDGTEIPLYYKLLPASLADRLQGGLFGGSSSPLRIQYMKDAWTIFTMAPIAGHGLAAFQGLYCEVQPFHYASKFIHNHILEVMTQMGILGLIPFLAFVGGALWLLIRRLRKGVDPMAAMLVACWVMMLCHGTLELTFSVRGFQCFAYLLLLLPVVAYGESPFRSKEAVKRGGAVLTAALALYLAVFGGLLAASRSTQAKASSYGANDLNEFLDTMEQMVKRDVFTGDNYRKVYVANAGGSSNAAHRALRADYAAHLRATGGYENLDHLIRNYYLPSGRYEEAFEVSREAIRNLFSRGEAWDHQLRQYYENFLPFLGAEGVCYVVDGTLAVADMMDEFAQTQWDDLVLAEENRRWISAVEDAAAQGLSDKELFDLLLETANEISDNVTVYGEDE